MIMSVWIVGNFCAFASGKCEICRRHRIARGLRALEAKIAAAPALAEGLLLIAGRRPIGPARAPIAGALGGPAETALCAHGQQDPARVLADVGGDAQLGAGAHDAGEVGSVAAETSRRLRCRFLGHGSGNRMKARAMRGVGQPAQQRAGVVGVEADVGELVASIARSTLTTPSSNGSQPIRPTCGLARACQRRCSPPPKPISSQTSSTRGANSSPEFVRRRIRHAQRDARQLVLEQRRCQRARLAAAPAPVAAQVVLGFLIRSPARGVCRDCLGIQPSAASGASGTMDPGHKDRDDRRIYLRVVASRAWGGVVGWLAAQAFSQRLL